MTYTMILHPDPTVEWLQVWDDAPPNVPFIVRELSHLPGTVIMRSTPYQLDPWYSRIVIKARQLGFTRTHHDNMMAHLVDQLPAAPVMTAPGHLRLTPIMLALRLAWR